MINQKQLEQEIALAAEKAIANDRVISAKWFTHGIVKGWESPDGVDADRWLLCGYEHVRSTFRRVVSRYALSPEGESQLDPQLTLEGFERVRKVYLVKRGGRTVRGSDQSAHRAGGCF